MLERLSGPLRAYCVTNAKELAEFSRARGRYELASEFWSIYVAGVREGAKPAPKMTAEQARERREIARMIGSEGAAELRKMDAEDRRDMKLLLKEIEPYQSEFPLLVATRNMLVASIDSTPQGISVADIKKRFRHDGCTSMGVIINQLARGGWVYRESEKATVLYPKKVSIFSDSEFFEREIAPKLIDKPPATPRKTPVSVVRVTESGKVIKGRGKRSLSCGGLLILGFIVFVVIIALTSGRK